MTSDQSGVADPDEEDRQLLARHLAGDRDAFGTMADRHFQRLWPVALRICREPGLAEDALQDAMIAAMRNAGSFRGDARVTTWLHRIVVNACLDTLRRRKRVTLVELPDDAGPSAVADADDILGQRELRLEVERALARLPADQRTAVVLVDVQGYSVAEAAAILGVPAGTVKSRSHRGRSRLAEHLAHLRNRTPDDSVQTPDEPGRRPPPPSAPGDRPRDAGTSPDRRREEG